MDSMSRRYTHHGERQGRDQAVLPRRLRYGDTIGVVAPASPFDIEQLYRGVSLLESAGFNVRTPKNIFLRSGYLAGPDAQRADLLMELFDDRVVKAIVCARGGFGSLRLLPLLDFDRIRKQPKILVGFSDVTALLAAIYARCGIVTFHGPLIASLPASDKESLAALVAAITSETPVEVTAPEGAVIRSGIGTGPVFAGNLTTFCHLIGTPFQPNTRGHILLFEDRGEAPYRLDRMITQMSMAGVFRHINGVAFGSFDDCGEPADFLRILQERFKNAPYPVLTGMEFGHGERNLTIPVGLNARLDATRGSLTYLTPATTE
jgi:muramoyltetrapeptide carboxypeptidase